MKRKSPIIVLENVWKIYKLGEVEVPAIRNISLKIFPNEFIAVMGPSGSGKSTALHLIGCLDVPTKGRIILDGKDISKISESGLANIRGKKIGFVFQQYNLFHRLTALENVMLPMTFQNVSENKKREKAKMLLKSVEMEKRMNHRPSELSGGEQQRIAIARALVNDPQIILADEPTGNLDSETGKKIMDLLIDLHKKEHKTIIVVTHDPYIAGYAKTILNLRDGQIFKDHEIAKRFVWRKGGK